MLKDHEIIISIKNIIRPVYFTQPIMRFLAKKIIHFGKHYSATPAKDEFIQFCVDNKGNTKFTDVDIKRTIKKLFRLKYKNKKFILDAATEFAQFSAMKSAIMQSAELIDNSNNRNKIRMKITDALKTGMDSRKLGTDIFEEIDERIIHRKMYGIDLHRISTGLKGLDDRIGGGLDKQELGVIMAPSKGFKTGTLVNLGFAALAQGLKVVHFTCEMSEDKTGLRYERRISGLDKKGIIRKTKKLRASMKRIKSIGGSLKIKEYPMYHASVADINNHLDYLESERFYADLVIVDYADILKPIDGKTEDHESLSIIYGQLKALAQERNIPVWTASQVKAGAFEKEIIRKEDIAGAIKKIAIVDMAIALCQNKKERVAETARLFVAANREGADAGYIYIKIDYDQMRIREMTDYSDAT